MRRTKEILVATSARLSPENIQWLKDQGLAQDRAANWILNNLITEARLKSTTANEIDLDKSGLDTFVSAYGGTL